MATQDEPVALTAKVRLSWWNGIGAVCVDSTN